jgi:mono/diheme cytochrome c family protein
MLGIILTGCLGDIGSDAQVATQEPPVPVASPPPSSTTPPPPPDMMNPPPPPPPPACTGEATGWLPKGSTQLSSLCGRGYQDPIAKAFCASPMPTVASLDDVLKTIGLHFGPGPYATGALQSGVNGNPGYVMTAQSTSITTRKVSQLNPRVILFTPPLARGRMTGTPKPNASYVAMGFTRGDEAVELLGKDPVSGEPRFFLLKYTLSCDAQPAGCTFADLYTPNVEKGFTGWSLYADDDLKDTTLDCLQCHQPNGPGTPKMMRMQELQRPWQHWMYNDATGVAALRADFHAAHGTSESYGGIPGQIMDQADVQQLEAFVENNGFINQPNEFKGTTILSELQASGTSATWQGQYSSSESGAYIPVPYFNSIATDPTKVQALVTQYTGVMSGSLPASALTDMSDVFTDPAERAMTHKPAAGLTGKQILAQVCQQCHNSRLDQTISRASFNVERLDLMSTAEKQEAIRRINTPSDACDHMPPQRFRELDANEIALVTAALQ